jgi:DNA-directed RNA polymerase specialized sigma24 family protein
MTCWGAVDDFERWYVGEHPRVLACCAALGGELDAAGEATDEAFLRALERCAAVAAMVSPGGWVQVVALNHLRRSLRRRHHERRQAKSRPADSGGIGFVVPDPELWALVASLPTRQRTAVVLRYVHDLPEAAIAEVMGIARGTVASTLAAAQAGLRRRLSPPVTGDDKTTHEGTLR